MLATQLLGNLVPNGPKSNSDGSRLRALARAETRSALAAIRQAERRFPPNAPLDGVEEDPGRAIAVFDAALTDPTLDPKAREIVLTGRASAFWFAGRFLESAQEFEPLPHCRDNWADSLVSAALFGQLPLTRSRSFGSHRAGRRVPGWPS